MTEKKRLTAEERQVIRLAHTSYLPNKTPLLDPHTEKLLDSERLGWDEVERLPATLEETERQLDEIKQKTHSKIYTQGESIKTSRKMIDDLFSQLTEARQQLSGKTEELAEAQQTIARQREALEWYGDPDKHEIKRRLLGDYAPITLDKGDKARKALKGGETRP